MNKNGLETTYTYSSANELLEAQSSNNEVRLFTYDANGNTIEDRSSNNEVRIYTYDNKNQLVKVVKPNGDVIEYTYDGNGNRYKKSVITRSPEGDVVITDRYYQYDTGGNIVSETDADNNVLVKYVRDNNGKAISMIQGSSTYYFLYNGHGDVTGLADSNGSVIATYSYDEFGNLTSSTGNVYNPLRYSAGFNAYFDQETNFYHIGTRYYDPSTGRWTRRDAYQGSQEQSQSQNRYVYCKNNPITEVDPQGFMSDSVRNALGKSRPGDIILTRFNSSDPSYFFTSFWTHALMRIKNKKGVPWIAEANKKLIKRPMYENFNDKNRQYNLVGVYRVKTSNRMRLKAANTIEKYVNRNVARYLFVSNYRTFSDGLNCTELVYRAWYDSSKHRISLDDRKIDLDICPISSCYVLTPDTFCNTAKTKQVGKLGYGGEW
ncbi:MAG: hypothetical protein C4562_02365 [Actinobacteria bacterium]|nr:MAG: hypothetical protein C4562_02365 [Actinomycetota bacterium]